MSEEVIDKDDDEYYEIFSSSLFFGKLRRPLNWLESNDRQKKKKDTEKEETPEFTEEDKLEKEKEGAGLAVINYESSLQVDEVTAKVLLVQAKLRKSLKKLEEGSTEYKKLQASYEDSKKSFKELNKLKDEILKRKSSS